MGTVRGNNKFIKKPRLIVGAHYDGHDLGQSALDNGVGIAVILEAALCLANTRKAYWHIAGDSLNNALPITNWANLGLMSLTNRYCEIRSAL